MKESRFISGTITAAAVAFLLMLLLGDVKFGISIILLALSFGLTFIAAIMTFVYWKKLKTGIRVVGIMPFLLFVILIIVFFYGLDKMD